KRTLFITKFVRLLQDTLRPSTGRKPFKLSCLAGDSLQILMGSIIHVLLLHFYLFLGSMNLTGQGILFEFIHI
ncbi:MAG: hypothetical protein AAB347_11435, partial [Bacteroidota bacterium]